MKDDKEIGEGGQTGEADRVRVIYGTFGFGEEGIVSPQ